MKILITIEDLRPGGAQVFALRLAQALHNYGHKVYLYSHYPTYINYNLTQEIAPDVPIIAFDIPVVGFEWLTRKMQGVLRRLHRPFPWREKLVARHLQQILERLQIEVLNSHMIKSDYVAADASTASNPSVPLVITMHGCYEDFLHKSTEPEVTLRSRQALKRAAGLIYLTEKNLEIFTIPGVRPLSSLPHAKIYNGFDGHFSALSELPNRAKLGIGQQDIVFGMVARGIAEKGWQYAIDSFKELNLSCQSTHLLLIGSSEYLTQLAKANNNKNIHFLGFHSNPIDWVRLFDVGLLPSYFVSESLPNSIAEYLFCGVPVIASRIGEIPQMLATPNGLAGVLLDQNGQGLTQPEALTESMRAYLTQPDLLIEHQKLATQCFDKFRMSKCIEAYELMFNKALSETTV